MEPGRKFVQSIALEVERFEGPPSVRFRGQRFDVVVGEVDVLDVFEIAHGAGDRDESQRAQSHSEHMPIANDDGRSFFEPEGFEGGDESYGRKRAL